MSVFATGGNKGADFFATAGDVATSAAVLTLDDGAGYDVRLEVHGSEGMVAVGLDDRAPLRSVDPVVTWPAGMPYFKFYQRFLPAYVTELGDFVAHVLGRLPNPCPPGDALEALYVAEAAQLSCDEGRPVLVEEMR